MNIKVISSVVALGVFSSSVYLMTDSNSETDEKRKVIEIKNANPVAIKEIKTKETVTSVAVKEANETTNRTKSIPLKITFNQKNETVSVPKVSSSNMVEDKDLELSESVIKGYEDPKSEMDPIKKRLIELKKIGLVSSEEFKVSDIEDSEEELPLSEITVEEVKLTKNIVAERKIENKEEFQEIKTQLPEEAEIIVNVRRGDSLSKIFNRAGLSSKETYNVNKLLSKSKSGFVIHPGDAFNFKIDQNGQLKSFVLSTINLENLLVKKENDTYKVEREVIEPEVFEASVSGVITSNLFLDAKKSGLNEAMIMELVDIFKWDIDFALDLKKNDKFTVIYEEKFIKGSKIGNGEILAAKFVNNGTIYEAIRHEDKNGKVSYYTQEGKSLSKAFIRSPVDFRRISSNFRKERYHPVLGVKRPHKGTDYAAKTGTPIKASGSGKIIFAGRKGGYGNAIIIKHANGITTLYGHQSKFAKGIRSGKKVKQGQTIGYVGATGVATGPHLHYEFRVNGVHKDPLKVKLPNDRPLAKSEMSRFKEFANKMANKIDVIENFE